MDLPTENVLVAHTKGDPSDVANRAIMRLYAAAEEIRERRRAAGKKDFEPGPPRARWSMSPTAPRAEWEADWAVHVPDDERVAPGGLAIERWKYGRVAEAMHEGPYDQEPATVRKLMDFIGEHGFHVAGRHEEVYLTEPDDRPQLTLIRYPVGP